MVPHSMPSASSSTRAIGARQFVVHEALETIVCFSWSYRLSLTPMTRVRSAFFAAAETSTFEAPASMCARALAASLNTPVDSMTTSTPRRRQGNCAGSRSLRTSTTLSPTLIDEPSATTDCGSGPYTLSYLSRFARACALVRSLTAATRMSAPEASGAGKQLRPMRPTPLIPTVIVMFPKGIPITPTGCSRRDATLVAGGHWGTVALHRAEAGCGRRTDPAERVLPEQRHCRARPGRRAAHRRRGARKRDGRPRGRPSRDGPARRGRLLDASALGSPALARQPRRGAPLRHGPLRGHCPGSAVGPGREGPRRRADTAGPGRPGTAGPARPHYRPARRNCADSLGWPSSPDYRASSACPGARGAADRGTRRSRRRRHAF